MIDTHAHLNFTDFVPDINAVILRAQKAGVKQIINIGSNFLLSQKAITLAEKHPNLFASVGLHPLDVFDSGFSISDFEKLAKNPKVVAIGEIGLDYTKNSNVRIQMSKQKKIFEEFLDLAFKLDKPVIIHCRDAEEDLIKILASRRKTPEGVWHCFMKDWQLAQQILDLGFLISFTGAITYNLSKKTKLAIENIPLGKIMIETDCPFMTPLAQREQGIKRCEPAFVVEVAIKIAEIKNLSLINVVKQTTRNTQNLFVLLK